MRQLILRWDDGSRIRRQTLPLEGSATAEQINTFIGNLTPVIDDQLFEAVDAQYTTVYPSA